MDEQPLPESPMERRITWGMIAAVIAFVVIMSAIVLWITASLIRFERGGVGGAATPWPTMTPLRTGTQTQAAGTSTPQATLERLPATTAPAVDAPVLVEGTYTPHPGKGKYVRFNYWFVKPNQIKVGECVRVTWETVNAVHLTLYRDGTPILEDAPANGTVEDCPTTPGYVVYRMEGVNSAGESNWIQLQVKVR